MEQQKIGVFLRALRTEKGLTQEQLAEKMGVTNRSVSRWETGTSLPDISLLVELAEFYGVELRELLNGERGSVSDKAVAAYTEQAGKVLARRMCRMFIAASAAITVYLAMEFLELSLLNRMTEFVSGLCLGVAWGMLIVGALYTGGVMEKLMPVKKRLVRKALGRE